MTNTTLRYYSSTLAYQKTERMRRIKDMKKQFRTRISRRRAKQAVKTILHKVNFV